MSEKKLLLSPQMERIAQQLAAAHEVDLSQKDAFLMVKLPRRPDWWRIANLDGRRISVTHGFTASDGRLTFDLDLTFVVHPTGWEPVELLYAPLPWQSYVRTAEFTGAPVCDDAGELLFVNFIEYWAQQIEAQGWLDPTLIEPDDEAATVRSAGDQVTCYAENTDSPETPMKTSPLMQRLVEHLAAKHGIDLSEPGRYLRLAMPGHATHLLIETTDARQVILGCYDGYGTEEVDPYLRFSPHDPTGWVPVEILCSAQQWAAFRQQTGLAVHLDDPDGVDLADFAEYWAHQIEAQGWLNRPTFTLEEETAAAADGRLPGCESTNHTQCYGELWQCSACGKTVCYAEGTDNYPELCDDCWSQRQMAEEEVDVPF